MSMMFEQTLKSQPLPAEQIPRRLSLILPEGLFLLRIL